MAGRSLQPRPRPGLRGPRPHAPRAARAPAMFELVCSPLQAAPRRPGICRRRPRVAARGSAGAPPAPPVRRARGGGLFVLSAPTLTQRRAARPHRPPTGARGASELSSCGGHGPPRPPPTSRRTPGHYPWRGARRATPPPPPQQRGSAGRRPAGIRTAHAPASCAASCPARTAIDPWGVRGWLLPLPRWIARDSPRNRVQRAGGAPDAWGARARFSRAPRTPAHRPWLGAALERQSRPRGAVVHSSQARPLRAHAGEVGPTRQGRWIVKGAWPRVHPAGPPPLASRRARRGGGGRLRRGGLSESLMAGRRCCEP